jgi:hypothetical protein
MVSRIGLLLMVKNISTSPYITAIDLVTIFCFLTGIQEQLKTWFSIFIISPQS